MYQQIRVCLGMGGGEVITINKQNFFEINVTSNKFEYNTLYQQYLATSLVVTKASSCSTSEEKATALRFPARVLRAGLTQCSPSSMFPEPDVSGICTHTKRSPMFPEPYVPGAPYVSGAMFGVIAFTFSC